MMKEDGNNGGHHSSCQLTIFAVGVGKTATQELACRATPENAKRTNMLPIVSQDGRMAIMTVKHFSILTLPMSLNKTNVRPKIRTI